MGWGWNRCNRRGLAAQNFKHHRAASRAFAFNGLATVFHCFFNAIGDFPFGLAFDAISFCHKKILTVRASCPNGNGRITKPNPERNPEKAVCQLSDNKAVRTNFPRPAKRGVETAPLTVQVMFQPGAIWRLMCSGISLGGMRFLVVSPALPPARISAQLSDFKRFTKQIPVNPTFSS